MSIRFSEGDEDEYGDEICMQTVELAATAVQGPAQGDDFWQHIDRTVSYTGPGATLQDDCWWEPIEVYGENWADAMEWWFNPLAFVSCESIAANPNLADMLVGPEPFGHLPGDLTFQEMCEDVGPWLAQQLGTGPLEGIWLIPMSDGWLDGYGNFEYFPPADDTQVETWGFFGYLLNDTNNIVGPGMDGIFYTLPILPLTNE